MGCHSLVSQLLLCHHYFHNVPESFILHLLPIFGDVTKADAGNLAHVLGRELKGVGGTAVTGAKQKRNRYGQSSHRV